MDFAQQQAKQEFRDYNTGQAQTGQWLAGRAVTEPSEPSMTAKAKELIGHLTRLSAEQYRIRERLLGGGPPGSAENSAKQLGEPSLNELLWRASDIAACLCGEASTILSKL